jgi:guanine deaminase
MSLIYDFALRGRIFTFTDNPFSVGDEASYSYYDDGVLLVRQDKIVGIGSPDEFELIAAKTIHFEKNYLIMPSFVDAHNHYPQLEIIGGHSQNLFEWLEKYAYKAEAKYAQLEYARAQARQFLLSLIDNGITAAGVFCTSHPNSVQALFEAADESNLHITAGQVWMDRNAPQSLLVSAEDAYEQSEALLRQWHNHGNLRYALTPRFAITSSPAQLEAARALIQRYPDLGIQSHISESPEELARLQQLYPEFSSYAALYDHYGLLTDKALYAHGNLLSPEELELFASRGSSLIHCPSVGEFLGQSPLNLCDITQKNPNLRVALGSDVGAGLSLTPWDTMLAAYRTSRNQGRTLSAIKALYLHTLGGAKSLNIAHMTGKFAPDYQADIAIVNTHADRTIAQRMQTVESIEEEFFVLMALGSMQTIDRLYVSGVKLK